MGAERRLNKKLQSRTKVKSEIKSVPRRRLLQALGVAGAVSSSRLLPDQWHRPVVDSIMLPVHARGTEPSRTSIRLIGPIGPDTSAILDQQGGFFADADKILDIVIPPANATHATINQAYCSALDSQHCITIDADAPDGQVSITINGNFPGNGTTTLNGLSIPLTGVGPWHVTGNIDPNLTVANGSVLDEINSVCPNTGDWTATDDGTCTPIATI